jgi:hypothetical protein
LVTFSGEAEKVTARRVGALAVIRKTAESLFQTPQPVPHRELFVPAYKFPLQRTPTPPQPQSNHPEQKLRPAQRLQHAANKPRTNISARSYFLAFAPAKSLPSVKKTRAPQY